MHQNILVEGIIFFRLHASHTAKSLLELEGLSEDDCNGNAGK